MAKIYFNIILIVLITSSNGQFSDILFPGWSQSAREIANSVMHNPIVETAGQLTGDVVAATLNTISSVPLAIARFASVGAGFPTLINDNNVVDLANRFAEEFVAGSNNEDTQLNITGLLRKYGKPVEEHEVQTSDGYLLTMHRIPSHGPVVFLMHGLLSSSDDYVVSGPDRALAYLLSDKGYDVWMGNARGNKHSRRHIKYQPSDAKFWNFSWHEIGCFDLPAIIDHVLNRTGESNLKYVGHSQGTTSFFVMASERPEYNKKISIMVALSPVVFMQHVTSPIVRMLAPGTPIFQSISEALGLYEFLPDSMLIRSLRKIMCGLGPSSEILCSNVMFLFAGIGFDQLDLTRLSVQLSHSPAGSSMKQFAHYGQGVVSEKFRKFDHGTSGNLEAYGTEIPPNYPLERISCPVSLFYSDADWLANPIDVDTLYNEINSTIDIYKIPSDQFNHLDFLYGKDIKVLIFDRLSKLLTHF